MRVASRHADGGYFGLVKHAEQVRYGPREALQGIPFWIGFGVVFTHGKCASLRAHFAGAAWLLGFDGWSKTASLPGSDALKKKDVQNRRRACQHMIGRCWLRLEWYERPEAGVLREALRPFRSIPQSGEKSWSDALA